jgi:signal transduction histidine kinase/ActR/RegA family two-component response regulator
MEVLDAPSDAQPAIDGAAPRGTSDPGSPGVTAEPRRSVRAKLMRLALVVTAVAVSLAGGAMVSYDLSVYRGSWATDLANEASILGISVAPALEFDDHELAARNLGAMRVRSSVLVAALYTSDGRLYASYARDSQSTPPPSAPAPGENVVGERVELSRPIARNGERLGTIYLRARYDVLSRVEAYVGIFCLVMALSLAVSYALSRRLQKTITDPLDAMAGAARQVVSRRDYSLRASKTTDDEIGIAVLAFNGMLDEVEARVRASDAANAALQTEVGVRQAAEAALREADRRKDEFLATLAHELRNPLAPIRHAVRLLETNAADEQQQQWGRAVIGRQVQRMALLLDDLLDVSRITRGLLHLKRDVVELRAVVQDALEVARPLIDAKGHLLSVSLPDEPLILSCDPLRLSQSLSNLLTNAAKYTDESGRIALTVVLSESELTLTVKDSGIGIDPQAIPGLFQIFSQLDSAIDRAEGGLGIGLALVKGLVALHGGRVEVASAGVGMGSEFTIHLPRAAVEVDTRVATGPIAMARDADRRGLRILLADDNRDACDTMSLVLELVGYEVLTAYGGKEALAMAARHRPDVALLDIGMPDMNGYEVARAVRQSGWGSEMYLIAITGWGQTEDKTRARAAGFDQHLTKPVDPDQVDRILCELGKSPTRPSPGSSQVLPS